MKKFLLLAFTGIFSSLYILADAASGSSSVPEAAEAPTVAADSVSSDDATDLEDFTVVTTKKLVQSDGAKLTYNVTEDTEAKTSNILDILRKVPGVTVDAEENVRVNGQSSFKILMNGHEDPMFKGSDLKTVLKSIPAATIKKIEVISEPGAKYEAEGVGGILNIVTDSASTLAGFVTNLSAWISNRHAGGYADYKTKINKVMLGATVNYNTGKLFPGAHQYSGSTSENFASPGSDEVESSYRTTNKSLSNWDYVGTRLNMSWEPDTLNLFTVSANYGYNTWSSSTDNVRTMYRGSLFAPDAESNRLWMMERHYRTPGRYNGTSAQASYQHNFGRTDNNLVLSYLYSYSFDKMTSDIFYVNIEGNPGTGVFDYPYSGRRERSFDNSHVVQLDYSNQFNSHHLLEAGAKMNLNNTRNGTGTYVGNTADDAQVEEAGEVKLSRFNNIYAVYASYSGTFSPVSVKAGVRYEHTRLGIDYHLGNYESFTTRLNDVVPNAAVSYNFTDASSLRAAYQMRISRPGLWCLNPYVNNLTPGNISYGDPHLKSAQSHNVSLAYSNYAGALSGSAKVTYSQVNDGVTDIIFFKEGLVHNTYANVGRDRSVEFELNGDWNILPSLRWSLYLSATYRNLKAESEMLKAKKHGWQYYGQTNINYTLPCKLRLSGYGGYYTAWMDLQSKGSDGYYYGIGASRSFLKDDALTLSLNASNLLPVSRRSHYTQTGETTRFTQHSLYKQWGVSFSISWRFGGLKAQIRQTNAEVETESSGNGGSKGGGKGGN